MNNLKKSIMSVAMAAITAASPILSSYAAYASDITVNDDGTVTQISTSTEGSTGKTDETKFLFIKIKTAGGKVVLNEGEDQEQRIRLDKKTDGVEYIDVYDKNNVLISSESTKDNDYTYVYEAKADDAVNVKAKADEGYKVKLYELTDDSSGTEIAEDVGFDAGNKVNSFKYPVFMEYDKTVKIGFEKTESADDIAKDLSVNDEAGKDKADEQSKAEADAESEDKTGEKDEPKSEETEDLKSKDAKADEKTAAEVSNDKKSEDTENRKTTEDADAPEKSEDLKDIDSNDKQDVSEEIAADNDLTVNTDDNKKDNEESDITVNDSSITKDIDENAGEEPNESSSEDIMDNNERSEDAKDADSDNSDKNFVSDETSDSADKDTTMNGSETEGTEKAEEAGSQTDNAEDKIENDKQDTEQSYDISNLDNTIFASARLVVISDNAESVSTDSKYIIANYQNIYLIQYETVEDAMKAYVKYTDAGLAAEPDAIISAASDELLADECNQTSMSEDTNPINFIYEENESTIIDSNTKLIALIDTGASDNDNITNRVSVIDKSFEGNGHGNEMVKSILEQNPNANILSIRAIDNNGHGNISGIIAAMEYALNQGAEIINLSISSRTTMLNSVLESEIKKAVNAGASVIAAAGNDGADVKDYMPGSVNEAIVVGACNESGERLSSSNYGYTVDYNVVADSTSQAAAKYSGYISSHDYIDLNSGLIFSPDYSEMVSDNDKKQLRAYYMLYDQTRPDPDEHTKYVFSTFNIYYPIEQTLNDMMLFKINPNASRYDYNANGITIDVDINRGAPEGYQHPITDECLYDEKTGYLSIPEQYKEEDITVTIWQSREDAFYKDFIPDEVKPQEDQTGMMTIARFANDFPYGYINPSYAYKGCNANVKLKGDPNSVKVGDLWTGSATTMYIGDTDWGAQVPYGWVAGSEAYGKEWRWGQIFNITSCQNKMFVNIGGAGEYGKSSKNWLWGGCISDIDNAFEGPPLVGSIYVECIAKSGNNATFYLHASCHGPQGQAAQTMVSTFTAIITPDEAEFTIHKRFVSPQLTQQTSRVGDLVTKFGIYTNKNCPEGQEVKIININGGKSSKAVGKTTLKAGIYYVKELKRISGTIENGKIYGPIKIKKGDKPKDLSDFIKDSDRDEMSMDENGYVLNVPFRFTGELLTKLKGDTLKPLEGAVFKVNYSEGTGSDYKRKRTWYFVTDKNGKIKYDRKHLADNDARFKGKVPASDEMFTTAADINKTALPVCELHIKEYLAPDGYNKDSKVHVIVIKALRDNNQKFTDKNAVADNTPTIEDPVAGDKWRIRVQAKKIDENGKGLTGAKFDIYDSEDCSGKPLATITSKDDGTTNIETIDNIPQTTETYEVWCKEVQAPPGYAILEIPVKLTFKLADFKKLSVEDQKKGELKIFGLTDGGKGIVNEKGWQVRIQTKKINRDKTPLAGAVFTIYSDEACKDADAITTITSGDDGMTDIAKILVPNSEQEKTFYCKETKAPQGKIIKETVFPLTFKKADYTAPDGELKTFGPKEGIINDEGWKVRVNAKKVDGDKKGLAGAKFTVYDNESLSNESILGVLESSADGTTNELSLGFNMNITEVTLYCQETTPPDGYIGTDEIFKVTFKKADYDKLKVQDANTKGELKTFSTGIVNVSVTPTPTISVTPTPPTPPSGGLYVKKTSKAPKDIMDLKSYTLANAEYRVTSSRAGDMGILTTDESGYSNVLSLPDNSIPHHLDAVYDIHGNLIQEAKDWIEKVQTTYYITEIKAPNYHSVYAGTKSQSVVMPDDAGQTFEIPFENEPIFCDGKLDIEKLGVKGEVVVGAVFKVEYFDADGPNESDLVRTWYLKSDTQGHVRMDEAHLDKNNQSDDFFKYDGNIVIPIGGYLQITEVDAPAEYVVETEPVGIATTKDADFKLTYDNAKAWYEELERCRVNLKKYEADGKTPIAGVEFEIKFLKQAIVPTSKMHPNFKRLLKEGESTIRHTDENGDVFFDNLDQGIYQITEIKTLDGNSLLKEPIIVTLPMTMTEDEANEYGNVNYETAKEDINYSGKWYFYECLYEITNNAVFKMPMTGDDGKWKYGFIGLGIVMAISAGFVICNVRTQKARKRKK